jgi:trans-aconitate 2-methyltransferase
MIPSSEAVQRFYDEFLQRRMVSYRVDGNMRIAKANKFFVANIKSDSTILDIGCGIGLATEAMAKKARKGRVVGLDLSAANIWYARQTISLRNASFHQMNIVSDSEAIQEFAGGPIDVFTMSDVIEHIPDDVRRNLFSLLYKLGSPQAKILVTIPSEFYQELLRVENPKELQIIDNVLTPEMLARESRDAGFALTYYRLIDMWQHVQYAHCVMEKSSALQDRVHEACQSKRQYSILRLGIRVANKLFLRKWRRRKYIDDVFGKP